MKINRILFCLTAAAVLAAGTPQQIRACPHSLTGQYI